jgi:hypothetical protein
MTQVRITDIADDFGTYYAMAAINLFPDMLGIDGFEIAGPAAAGIKFGI